MKPIRWSSHASQHLVDREIDLAEAERTVAEPESVMPTGTNRAVYMRRYFDHVLQQEMLLRIVVEQTVEENVVVTLYKTSRIAKYLGGGVG